MAMAKKIKIEKPTMQQQSQRYVSDDIILEILLRLPVNSLLRYTSISKSWEALIKSPSFISAHHQISKKLSRSRLLWVHRTDAQCCILMPVLSDGALMLISIPQLRETSVCIIIGCFEGLVCLTINSIICLFNPFIRTLKRINPMRQIRAEIYGYLGFGFAPQRGDHRIVKLLVEGYLIGAEIYSLLSDSWTRIKPPSGRLERYKFVSSWSKVFFKGSIYMLTCLLGQNRTMDIILRIDLEREKIEEIDIDTMDKTMGYCIVVVNGILVLFQFEKRGDEALPIKGYIYKKSELGSSSWTTTRTVDLPMTKADTFWDTTKSGHIIFERSSNHGIFAYECFCDGKNLSFKLKNLGINTDFFLKYRLITPIEETLHLIDR